jgi:signal transduction histidine kinase
VRNAPPSRLSRTAGVFLVATGALVLLGWRFDLHVLKGLSGPITMKPNAAVGLLAAGTSLLLLRARSAALCAAGQGCALVAAAIGSMTLSEHLVGWDLGIDQLLFPEPPGAAATTSPARMGPNSSLSLTLSGLALLCLYHATASTIMAAQLFGAAVAVLALVPTVGYVYGAQALYAVAKYTGIAFHTGIAFLVLSAGLLSARQDAGPVASITTDAPSGLMARRLLAAAILVPLFVGYLRVAGERLSWYDTGLGAALFVVAMMVMLSIAIWRAAVAFGRSDVELRRVQQEREDLLVRERAARETAERADRAKDEFIAALSHELRTPLNAILGWMYMLQQDRMPESSRGKATDAVLRNAGVLSRLIEDLLDTSRITTGHLVLSASRVHLSSVVQAAVESVIPIASANGTDVVFAPAPGDSVVVGDAQRLQQVVWNLLSNAIKFSPRDRKVHVQVQTDADAVIVSVADEGEGITREFLPHVFERLRQADASTTRAQGGLGLGLFIAKHLTMLHGGTLEAHSDGPGHGAVFTLRLPAAPGNPAVPASAGPVQVSDTI